MSEPSYQATVPGPRNPFRPSFGTSPYYLAGRAELLQDFELSLAEGPGSPHRTILASGLRGVGKTVLLNEIEDKARTQGWIVLRAYPNSDTISELVETTILTAITSIEQPPERKLSGASITGVGSFRTEAHSRAEELRSVPTLITRLRELSDGITGAGILITLDELQSADLDQLHRLATAVQDLMRDERDIALVCAGLPHGVDTLLQHEGTTFLRRAFRVDLHAVPTEEVSKTLAITAADSGRPFTDDALVRATDMCRGYPYLIQVVGALSWAAAGIDSSGTIEAAHVETASQRAIDRMTSHVHRPALSRLPEGEMNFLRAMAAIIADEGAREPESATTTNPETRTAKTGDIAAHLGVEPRGLSTWRSRLITRDLIEPAGFGHVRFTLPYMDDYIRQQDA
ncbi:ATP-binding protein [Corynebacterium macclintockiae]|uniref:ATP-binding protein n=1 Tax=Corynebacterium macclintockiae TaxID=2913501 RepID=UPI003EBE4541